MSAILSVLLMMVCFILMVGYTLAGNGAMTIWYLTLIVLLGFNVKFSSER